MNRLMPYLRISSVEELWAHHTDLMASYGFDRLFYAFNAFHSGGMYANPDDAILLTNMPPDYVEAYVSGGMFRDGIMMRWALENTGCISWREVYAQVADETMTDGQRAMRALNERHRITAGYTISFPMTIKNATAGIGLVVRADLDQDDADAIWAKHGEELEIINHVAHLCIMQLPATGPPSR